MPESMDTPVPFRWDLLGPDQLGSMIDPEAEPDLWFLPGLMECTGRVLARSGGGDLVFVGRSLDSMFDLLGGALAGCDRAPGLDRLPLSFAPTQVFADGKWSVNRSPMPSVGSCGRSWPGWVWPRRRWLVVTVR